jgi:hypothetical protein
MASYRFIIGSMDDFQSVDELIEAADSGESQGNMSIFEYELESDLNQVAVMYGRGLAFSSHWCMEHTLSFCHEI